MRTVFPLLCVLSLLLLVAFTDAVSLQLQESQSEQLAQLAKHKSLARAKTKHKAGHHAAAAAKVNAKAKAKGDYITGDEETASFRKDMPEPVVPHMRMQERNFLQLEGTYSPPPAVTSGWADDAKGPQPLVTADTVSLTQVSDATRMSGGGAEANNLQQGLEELKADIVEKSHQVMEEKKWVEQVRDITHEYELKMHRVDLNINNLRTQVKDMFKKKKQIENMMLQKKLERKLQDATSDLGTLQTALHHVKHKQTSFERNKEDVTNTISAIKTQLNRLQGKPDDAPLDESELEDDEDEGEMQNEEAVGGEDLLR